MGIGTPYAVIGIISGVCKGSGEIWVDRMAESDGAWCICCMVVV